MMSQTVEYALRAMVLLASDSSHPQSVETIAERTRVPSAYLSKVLQHLARAKLVNSRRGVHGGYLLARGAEDMTILDVVNAVDPIRRIESCPLDIASHGGLLCPLHRRLDNALASLEETFGATTLAEVIAEPSASVPLCEFPDQR